MVVRAGKELVGGEVNLHRGFYDEVDGEGREDDERADEPVVGVHVLAVGPRLGEGVGEDDVLEGGHREDGVVLPARDLRVRDRSLVVVSLRRGVDVGGVVGVEGDEPVLRADVLKGENLQ